MKNRLIVLTDIKRGLENDDIQSLVRLLLYSNDIDIEGLITSTSCWAKNASGEKERQIILSIIDSYEKVKPNLDAYSEGYPEADYLRSVSLCGIPQYGRSPGRGFGELRFNKNEGVRRIIDAVDKADDRPLWVALWAGANTLAQAIWQVSRERDSKETDRFLAKLRIHSISDQDAAGYWLRYNFGEKLFYIVSPSPAEGARYYRHAAWPGIAADRFAHGSEDGEHGGGFSGADKYLVSKKWILKNIRKGVYGRCYPLHRFIMEGDTPSFLGLIPNGLNQPEHPDYGGWGGRYELYRPSPSYTGTEEPYKIWTNASDCVHGNDNRYHRSPQATIWRWREDFQNDFAVRIQWTLPGEGQKRNTHPVVRTNLPDRIEIVSGEKIELNAEDSYDPEGGELEFLWFVYKEAGTYEAAIKIINADCSKAFFIAPEVSESRTVHVILSVKNNHQPSLTRYKRIIFTINPFMSRGE